MQKKVITFQCRKYWCYNGTALDSNAPLCPRPQVLELPPFISNDDPLALRAAPSNTTQKVSCKIHSPKVCM